MLLNTIWLSMLYGDAFTALLPLRLLKNAALCPLEALMLFVVAGLVRRVAIGMGLWREQDGRIVQPKCGPYSHRATEGQARASPRQMDAPQDCCRRRPVPGARYGLGGMRTKGYIGRRPMPCRGRMPYKKCAAKAREGMNPARFSVYNASIKQSSIAPCTLPCAAALRRTMPTSLQIRVDIAHIHNGVHLDAGIAP